jgi:uncharacterized Zn finger protein
MKEFACRKCGSADLFIKKNGTQTGLYCSECGAWQKWLSKDDERLAQNWIDKIHKNNNDDEEINVPLTDEQIKDIKEKLDEIEYGISDIKSLLGIN